MTFNPGALAQDWWAWLIVLVLGAMVVGGYVSRFRQSWHVSWRAAVVLFAVLILLPSIALALYRSAR